MRASVSTPVSTASIDGTMPESLSRPSLAVEATLAAVVGAVLYSLSPATAWLAIVVAVVIGWAARGLPSAERRWVIGILAISAVLRAIAIAGLAWRNDPTRNSFSTIFGDGAYAITMSLWIRNTYLGLPIAPRDFILAFGDPYAQTSYHNVLAVVQVFIGPAPYGVHVLSATLYLTGVVALYRTARRSYGPIPALIGLTAILFLPSLFLWSILPLKESLYFFCMAVLISAASWLFRSRTWIGAGAALVLAAGALAAISSLRAGGLVIAVGGLVIGLAATLAFRWRLVLAMLLLAAPFAAAWTVGRPTVHERILHAVRESALRHVGHVLTPGTSYKLLSLDYYRGDRKPEALSFDEGAQFLAKSVLAFVLVPEPWDPAARIEIYMAPQQVAWYALVLFALVGVVAGLDRDPFLTCLLAGNVMMGIIVIAPNSGNVGTLIRHRDMVVPFVVWLSGMGMMATLNQFGAARPGAMVQ
jgi:hypothetical protein